MLLTRYLLALGLTLAVEVPLYTLALRGVWRVPVGRAALLAVAVNAATHPVLWWALAPWNGRPWYPVAVVIAEVAACAVEWLLLRQRLGIRTPALALAAVGVNAASVAAGLASLLVSAGGAP